MWRAARVWLYLTETASGSLRQRPICRNWYCISPLLSCGNRARRKKDGRLVLKGLLLGAVLNCVWAVLDGLCYYVAHFSLNNVVFSAYIERHGIALGMSLILGNGLLRAAGFNTDPANIGFWAGRHCRAAQTSLRADVDWFIESGLSASTTAAVVTIGNICVGMEKSDPEKKAAPARDADVDVSRHPAGHRRGGSGCRAASAAGDSGSGPFAERFNGVYVKGNEASPRKVYYAGFFKALLTAGVIAFLRVPALGLFIPYIENTELFHELSPTSTMAVRPGNDLHCISV